MTKISPSVLNVSSSDLSPALPAQELFLQEALPPQGPYLEEALLPQGPYFEALRADDAPSIELCLEEASEQERNTLLNGRFQFHDVSSIKNFSARQYSLTLPLSLAACHGSIHACEVLIRWGANPVSTEPRGRLNLFHCLIAIAFYEPQHEQRAIATYRALCGFLPVAITRRLLETENEEGFRPLEFAVQQGTLAFMAAIFETRDVYLVREERHDLMTYHWYDVTEYEATLTSRRFISPLALLVVLDRRHAATARQFFKEGCLREWMYKTMRVRMPAAILLFLLRLLQVTLLYVYESDRVWLENIGGLSQNEESLRVSSGSSLAVNATFVYCEQALNIRMPAALRYVIAVYLVVYSALSLFARWCAVLRYAFTGSLNQHVVHDLSGRSKEMIILRGGVFDTITEFCFASLVIAEVVMLPFIHERGNILLAVHGLRTLLTLDVFWCLLMYAQIIPGAGPAVILIREMMSDLISFALIFIFAVALFSRQFMLFFDVNSTQGCIEDFGSFSMAMYNLFLAMLYMLDFTQYSVYDRAMLFVAQFVYSAIVGILLLNLLIAVFSNTMMRVNEDLDVIVGLSKLSLFGDMELMLAYLPILNRVSDRIYPRLLKGSFECENGRVYLVCAKTTCNSALPGPDNRGTRW